MSNRLSKLLKPIKSLLGASDREMPPLNAAGEMQATQPVQVSHVWTPEPNAIKLQVNRLLLPLGEKREYTSIADASTAPLAQTLFAEPGVEKVVIESAFVTVLMAENADWDGLMERLPILMKKHFGAGLPAVKEAPKKKYSFKFTHIPSRTSEQQFEIVQRLIDEEINPAVAAHGGHFTLLDVRENRVFVKLGGGCQGCGMVDATLRQGVEQRLKQVLPEIVALIDVTDHAAGENPYYTADAHAGHTH
jgi:Fe-S cluster biogenesis protein NfuA